MALVLPPYLLYRTDTYFASYQLYCSLNTKYKSQIVYAVGKLTKDKTQCDNYKIIDFEIGIWQDITTVLHTCIVIGDPIINRWIVGIPLNG